VNLSLKQADHVLRLGIARANELGVPMNIAVLDAGGHLKAFTRMAGVVLGSIDIAVKKAKTAALFGMNTEAVGEFCKPGGTSPGLADTQRRPRRLRGRQCLKDTSKAWENRI
jgi:uncharacterized protein GlcG (DUF336 family)